MIRRCSNYFHFHFHIILTIFCFSFFNNLFHFCLFLKVDKISKTILEIENYHFHFHPAPLIKSKHTHAPGCMHTRIQTTRTRTTMREWRADAAAACLLAACPSTTAALQAFPSWCAPLPPLLFCVVYLLLVLSFNSLNPCIWGFYSARIRNRGFE